MATKGKEHMDRQADKSKPIGKDKRKEDQKVCTENYTYFKQVLPSLLETMRGKFVVIKEAAIIGKYETFDDAYTQTIKTEEIGTFLIQECIELEASSAQFAWSNVSFASV